MMSKYKLRSGILVLAIAFLVTSCGVGLDQEPITDDAEKWNGFVDALSEKVGTEGGYSLINYRKTKDGFQMKVELTDDVNSGDYGEYEVLFNSFAKNKSRSISGSGASNPSEFFYKLSDYDLHKIPNLIQISRQMLKDEKQVEDAETILFSVSTPNVKTKALEEQFNIVIWQYSPSKNRYYSFAFNIKDSCEMMAELPADFKPGF